MATAHHRDSGRRLVVAGVVVAAVAVPAVLLTWAPWARTLPEVERAFVRCPTPSPTSSPSPSPPAATGPLVPELRYRMVQLCPLTPAAGRTEVRLLDDRTSGDLVRRLNGLAAAPPSPECATAPAVVPVDLILTAGGTRIVVRLDTGPCGTARHDTAVRYGAGALHDHVTALLRDR